MPSTFWNMCIKSLTRIGQDDHASSNPIQKLDHIQTYHTWMSLVSRSLGGMSQIALSVSCRGIQSRCGGLTWKWPCFPRLRQSRQNANFCPWNPKAGREMTGHDGKWPWKEVELASVGCRAFAGSSSFSSCQVTQEIVILTNSHARSLTQHKLNIQIRGPAHSWHTFYASFDSLVNSTHLWYPLIIANKVPLSLKPGCPSCFVLHGVSFKIESATSKFTGRVRGRLHGTALYLVTLPRNPWPSQPQLELSTYIQHK